MNSAYVSRVVDLTHPEKNLIYNKTHEQALEALKNGDLEEVRKIDGQFALVSVEGRSIRMARSIGRPIRYFIAKLEDGPCLVVGERIDAIYEHLKKEGLVLLPEFLPLPEIPDRSIPHSVIFHRWHRSRISVRSRFLGPC